MTAAPPGAARGMRVTISSVGIPLSMGLFFTLLVAGLKRQGSRSQGHSARLRAASRLHLRRVLGLQRAEEPARACHGLPSPPAQAANLTGRSFLPHLIRPSLVHGLSLILTCAIIMSVTVPEDRIELGKCAGMLATSFACWDTDANRPYCHRRQ